MRNPTKPTLLVAHGAFTNGGDFLIWRRATEAMKRAWGSTIRIRHGVRDSSLDARESDGIVIAGGPIVTSNWHPQLQAVETCLQNAPNAKPIVLGVGVEGRRKTRDASYFADDRCVKFWQRLGERGTPISVRDLPTQIVLAAIGVNATFTGCPALQRNEETTARPTANEPESIAVSVSRIAGPLALRRRFTNRLILDAVAGARKPCSVIMQHGIGPNESPTVALARRHGFDIVDASNQSLHDVEQLLTSDVHIGTRLHANILAISEGIPSFLVDVDNRTRAFRESFACDGTRAGLRLGKQISAWLASPAARLQSNELGSQVAKCRFELNQFLQMARQNIIEGS